MIARSSWTPLSVPVLIDAGLWHGANERFDLALSLCRKAMEIDPLQSLAYRCVGNTLDALGRSQEASVSFAKAVDLAPDSLPPLRILPGCVYAKAGAMKRNKS